MKLIKQISVFVENKSGRLSDILNVIGKNGIDISALSIADTTDFGIVRMIVNDPDKAAEILKSNNLVVKVTDVIALAVADKPGGLAGEIEKLKNELNNRYADLDQRLETLQQKVEPSEESATPEEDNQQGTAPSTNNSTLKAAPVTNTPSPAPTIKTSSVVVPAKPTTAQVATAKSTVPVVKSDELDKAAYTVALDAYKQGGAKKAIAPMQNFIKNNPNSVYISNAHFWLAEFNLAIEPTNYAEAKRNYSIVVNKYPNSSRASRALYQLYSIAKDVDRNTAQAGQYKQKLLKSYPQSEEAKYFK